MQRLFLEPDRTNGELRKRGVTQTQISEKFGCTLILVNNVIHRPTAKRKPGSISMKIEEYISEIIYSPLKSTRKKAA